METEILINFAAFAAVWGSFSPLVINFIKNVGVTWPSGVKKGIAFGSAVLGALIAYGTQVGWDVISLTDWTGFWLPLLGAFGAIYPIMITSYSGFWKGTKVSNVLAAVGDSSS